MCVITSAVEPPFKISYCVNYSYPRTSEIKTSSRWNRKILLSRCFPTGSEKMTYPSSYGTRTFLMERVRTTNANLRVSEPPDLVLLMSVFVHTAIFLLGGFLTSLLLSRLTQSFPFFKKICWCCRQWPIRHKTLAFVWNKLNWIFSFIKKKQKVASRL